MDNHSEIYRKRLQQFIDQVSVYPVSCERLGAGRDDREWLDGVLAGGASIVQLRDKDSEDHQLLQKAKYFRQKTKEAGALFLVNDRVDIGMLADADGIHLGQKDLPPSEVRLLVPDMLIGVSCNTEEQAKELGELEKKGIIAASYYNIGPLYPTKTKDGLSEFIGPQAIDRFSAYLTLPFTVMGGIKLGHVGEISKMGGRRIAVVTALSQADDICAETEKWIRAIKEARRIEV